MTYKFYYGRQLQGYQSHVQLLESPDTHDEIYGITFEGLLSIKKQYGSVVPLNIRVSKQGEQYLQFQDALFSRITAKNCKPWKLIIRSEETDVSMKELMWFDSQEVIQYLKERGITTCPMVV